MKRKYVEALGCAALDYLEHGLSLFHRCLRTQSAAGHAAFGNLATALELAFKRSIAAKNLGAVFPHIPADARALLSAPEHAPEFFRWQGAPIDLWSDAFRTLDLGECIACYYAFYPHMKQPLFPHLDFIACHRDAALHTALPPLEPYDFDRCGYATLQAIRTLAQDNAHGGFIYTLSEADTQFLERFAIARAERVSLALEQARLVERMREPKRDVVPSGWLEQAEVCPVCRRRGILRGYSELSMYRDEEVLSPTLDFFAISFSCPGCGLSLRDFDELKLVGMATLYDRSGELDDWFAEHGIITERE